MIKQLGRRLRRFFNSTDTDPDALRSNVVLPTNVRLDATCRLQGIPRIEAVAEASIVCGPHVVLNSNPEGYHAGMGFPVTLLADRSGANITIGEGSRLHGCCVHAWSRIQIGRHCLLAAGSQVLDAHGHATELELARLRAKVQDVPGPIEIGDYCWLGLGALVLKGVRLGEGCIVSAYSVVLAGEYPPFSLVAGSPAKVVRTVPAKDVYPEDYPVEQVAIGGRKTYEY